MTKRSAKASALFLALALSLTGAALHAQPAAPPDTLFVVVAGEGGPLVSQAIDLSWLKRVAPADSCNGGSCLSGLGSVLNCPTSGGPTCNSTQPCGCICLNTQNGTWTTANFCFPD
jgi:hypothetical protein